LGNTLETLRAKNPTGNNFPEALAAEYLAYAESLSEEGHPIRSAHFAQKGLDALAGRDVPLEENDAYDENRKSLMRMLTPDVKEIAGAKAARAQMMFDCWADGKALCEDGFVAALSDVEYIADLLVHGDDNQFTAQFETGSSVLTDKSIALIDVIGRRVAGYGEYQIELMAYANKPKASRRVKALASDRILAIEKALITRGVDAGRIHKHPGVKKNEVFLSVDEAGVAKNTIAISIQTFGQLPEPKKP
jgi:hypothetical protein